MIHPLVAGIAIGILVGILISAIAIMIAISKSYATPPEKEPYVWDENSYH